MSNVFVYSLFSVHLITMQLEIKLKKKHFVIKMLCFPVYEIKSLVILPM